MVAGLYFVSGHQGSGRERERVGGGGGGREKKMGIFSKVCAKPIPTPNSTTLTS